MYGKIVLLIVISMLGGGAAFSADRGASERVQYEKACNHYVNRAKFKPRGAPVSFVATFVVTLADSCLPALKSLGSMLGAERAAAADYLSQLVTLRDTVIDMNMERAFGNTYDRWTRMTSQRGRRDGPLPQVSATGEYLIAHRMGLLQAYRAWLDTGPELAFGLSGAIGEPLPRP